MLHGPGLLPRSGGKAKKLVVFIHGYGSNGNDLLSLAPHWSQEMPEVEFLAPNGPEAWEMHSSGYQWYGLKDYTIPAFRLGLGVVRPLLRDYLLKELSKRDLQPEDLALVGFSQGGVVALDMMFDLPGLGGIISYSGGFVPPKEGDPKPANFPKVLLVHGDMDMVLPYVYFLDAKKHLEDMGLQPHTLTCSGLGHSIDDEGLKMGSAFLKEVFDQPQSVIYMKQEEEDSDGE